MSLIPPLPPMRPPDLHGPSHWSAWRVSFPPEPVLQISFWMFDCPGAHAFWRLFALSTVSLTDIEGIPPARKHYPEATHELCVFALNPNMAVDPDEFTSFLPALLQGPNVCMQFHGLSDEQVKTLADSLAREVANGRLSPDSDYRSSWDSYIRTCVLAVGKVVLP